MAKGLKGIGRNPRTYYGFKKIDDIKKHIKEFQPNLSKGIGKIKKLKRLPPAQTSTKSFNRHLVYFKESKI